MNSQELYVADLIYKHLQGEITEEEKKLLRRWIINNPANKAFFEKTCSEDRISNDIRIFGQAGIDRNWEGLEIKINSLPIGQGKAKVISINKSYWKIALGIIAGVVIVYFLFFNKHTTQNNLVQNSFPIDSLIEQYNINNLPPRPLSLSYEGTLTLHSGQTYSVGIKSRTDLLLPDGGCIQIDSQALKYGCLNSMLRFVKNDIRDTLATPPGGQCHVYLTDSSKIHLNAASSLSYPRNLATNERRVELSGEAYFEVFKDSSRPFIVIIDTPTVKHRIEILVYGTKFNVKAYKDDGQVRITLFEGSLSISQKGDKEVLQPNQQAVLSDTLIKMKISDYNLEADALAWQNSSAVFKNAKIRTVMQQIARWYNVEISYSDSLSDVRFTGTLPRYSNYQTELKILALAGINFQSESNKIVVGYQKKDL